MKALVGVVTVLAALVVAGAAQAATVIGQTSPADGPPGTCPQTVAEWVQDRVKSGPSYTVPGPGVITSWSTLAEAAVAVDTGDQVALRVYVRGVAPGLFTPVAESEPVSQQAPFLHQSGTRIPVDGGETIGLRTISFGGDNASACRRAGLPLDTIDDVTRASLSLIPIGQPANYPNTVFQSRLDLSATLEPDADGDEFGDETQDKCAIQATVQGDCDLTVSISKKPKKKTKSKKATIDFAGIGGVTFECRLDKKDFASCAPPVSLKKLKVRKHNFRIRALGQGGSPGAETVVRWRVTGG